MNTRPDASATNVSPRIGEPAVRSEERQVIQCSVLPREQASIDDAHLVNLIQRLIALGDKRSFAMTATIKATLGDEASERPYVVVTGARKRDADAQRIPTLLQGFLAVVDEAFPERAWSVEDLRVERASAFRQRKHAERDRSLNANNLLAGQDVAAWVNARRGRWSDPATALWLQRMAEVLSAGTGLRTYVDAADLERFLQADGPGRDFGPGR